MLLRPASGRRKGIPLVFDPLIDAFDKPKSLRQKFSAASARQTSAAVEQACFLLALTGLSPIPSMHAHFAREHAYPIEQICVLPVGAEEELFKPQAKPANQLPEALFFGTFIGLQGATYIAEAVGLYQGPVCRLTFLGTGPDQAACEDIVRRVANPNVQVAFEEWVPLTELPASASVRRICALVCLALETKPIAWIPNKVYQSLACDRPVITMAAQAYPEALRSQSGCLWWCSR